MYYDLLFLALFIICWLYIIFFGDGFFFFIEQKLLFIRFHLKWILSMFGNTLGYRWPIKVRKTMFLISGINIFFSFYPLFVFMSTIAFICHLFLCLLFVESHWEANYGNNLPSTICIILEIRGKASLSFLSVRVALLLKSVSPLCSNICSCSFVWHIWSNIMHTGQKV